MKLDFEKFLNDKGLKLGDKVRLTNIGFVYEIAKNIYSNKFYLKGLEKLSDRDIQLLQEQDFELVKPKKKVGDLICYDIAEPRRCTECPLQCITCGGYTHDTLRERFEEALKEYPQLEPLRSYFEKELDKEIEDEN